MSPPLGVHGNFLRDLFWLLNKHMRASLGEFLEQVEYPQSLDIQRKKERNSSLLLQGQF